MLQSKNFFKNLFAVVFIMGSVNLHANNLPDKLLNMPIQLISGEHVSLAQYKGEKPVYLKFWATWCQPCLKEMPHFNHVKDEYGEAVEVIGINLGINDDLNSVKKIIEEFGLTMPMAIDKSGDLAQAFRMVGTPYHLLFDRNMNLIHQGHEANESLDNKLALVSKTKPVDLLNISLLSENESNVELTVNDGKIHALFFTATWCDWYFKDSRPKVSENCISAQKYINELAVKYPNISWNGIISRLWTGDKDMLEYKKKYSIQHNIVIDKSNHLFHQYSVNSFPTLILVKNGKVVSKEINFNNKIKLEKLLVE